MLRLADYHLRVTEQQRAKSNYGYIEIADMFDKCLDALANLDTLRTRANIAVTNGLGWLYNQQIENGSWSNNVAITSLAVLALLNFGIDEGDPIIDAGLQYIISNIHPDGSVGSESYRYTYYTSMAILPLVATHNSDYNDEITNMVNWLIGSQWDENSNYGSVDRSHWYYGGFGYGNSSRPDLSNTQWALMGLSAGGLSSDNDVFEKALIFLGRCQNADRGSGYYPGAGSIHTMTAASVWSYALCGKGPNYILVDNGLQWLTDDYSVTSNDGWGHISDYYYALTFAKALVMSHKTKLGNHDWFEDLLELLEERQTDDRNWPGGGWLSYNPQADKELTSCYSILALQTRALAPEADSSMSIILASHADLHAYDPYGRHVGVNYETMTIEENIPGATFTILNEDGQEVPYSGESPEEGLRQVISLPLIEAGAYRIELIGTSDGPFHVTINGQQDGETVTSNTYVGEITTGERLATFTTVTAMEGAVTLLYEPLSILPALGISPDQIELIVEPDSIETLTFTVSEIGAQETLHSVSMYASDFHGEQGHIIGSNVIFDVNNFDIPPGETQIVNASIPIPVDFRGPSPGTINVESADGGTKRIDVTLITSLEVMIDICPEDCPDFLGVKGKGQLPLAILGAESFDVTQIDPESLRLEGVLRKRWNLEDVTRPQECNVEYGENSDGHRDLTAKFSRRAIVDAIGVVNDGEVLTLTLTGNLKEEFGRTPIQGEGDVIIEKD